MEEEESMYSVERNPSIAYVGKGKNGFVPRVSHQKDHSWKMGAHPTKIEAVAHVEAIWFDIQWVTYAEWCQQTKGCRYTSWRWTKRGE